MELPSENKRVKEIIDFYCKGNVNQFSKLIGVSQPRISRLFNLDPRSGKYPLLSLEIAQSIINKFVNVSSEWLLTGNGEMLPNADTITLTPNYIMTSPEVSNLQETKKQYNKADEAKRASLGEGIPLIPVDAWAGAAANEGYAIDLDTIEERYHVPLFDNKGVDFMMYVRGSSMHPKYSNGDVIACKFVKELIFIQWNKVYVIDSNSQGAMIKRLLPSSNPDNIICRSDNPDYLDFEIPRTDIINIALVIGCISLE